MFGIEDATPLELFLFLRLPRVSRVTRNPGLCCGIPLGFDLLPFDAIKIFVTANEKLIARQRN